MNYKIDNLYNKVYSSFIRGEYPEGPKIPTKNEVLSKIEEITTSEYIPITKNDRLNEIDIDKINEKFSNIIDDIDILYSSIESQSKEVLSQLTNSLKEHNGVKSELKLINNSVQDISNGKLGEEFLTYNFTETFNDSTNINLNKSDPINYDAGLFTINKDFSNYVNLKHYYGTKLDFIISESYSLIIDNGYIGDTDASLIFDQVNPRQLIYYVKTSSPTSLKLSTSIQLNEQVSVIDINSVIIDIDSDVSKGLIRLYYKDNYEWKDVKTNSIQEIINDKIIFNFPSVKTSHIKIEFIKNSPDSFLDNSYYFAINNISISKSVSKRTATMQSNAIILNSYNNDVPFISNISVSGDYDVPNNCDMKIYVSPDIKISGAFVDSFNSVLDYRSPNIYKFDPTYSGSVYLSEIMYVNNLVSGIFPYKSINFNWQELKLNDKKGESIPELIDFSNTIKNIKLDNSLFKPNDQILFGDSNYIETYNVSGWVNVDNENWSILESMVISGMLVSGVDIATLEGVSWNDIEDINGIIHPDILANPLYSGQWIGYNSGVGYPFGYTYSDYVLKFGDYSQSYNGWWRPYVESVTLSGIDPDYTGINGFLSNNYVNYLPDFYFNNNHFYKIYKFGYGNNVIDQSIRLYTYQERPINNIFDRYPCTFVWKYKTEWIDKIDYKINDFDPTYPSSWDNYIIPISSGLLNINEEYIIDSITDLKIHNSNSILDRSEYQILYNDNTINGLLLKGLSNRTGLIPSGITFDYKYQYRVKNEYLSTWTAFVIVSPGSSDNFITISNVFINEKNIKLIQKIVVENIDNGQVTEFLDDTGGSFYIDFMSQNTQSETHYKITIFCASDENTGFCAYNWIPYQNNINGTINVSPYIKIVSKLESLKIVSFDNLLYNTSFSNDNKAAIYEENNEKYIVVKKPFKDYVPGYYFNYINKKYYYDPDKQIENKSHWIRSGDNINIYYTTGSSGNFVYKKGFSNVDINWNGGVTLVDFPNYTGYESYQHHSTYGYPINIDNINEQSIILYPNDIDPRAPISSGIVGSSLWLNWLNNTNRSSEANIYQSSNKLTVSDYNRGFLFYDTAENLPSYYSISYRLIKSTSDINNRFLYKIELISDDDGSLVPKVRSINFIINKDIYA